MTSQLRNGTTADCTTVKRHRSIFLSKISINPLIVEVRKIELSRVGNAWNSILSQLDGFRLPFEDGKCSEVDRNVVKGFYIFN